MFLMCQQGRDIARQRTVKEMRFCIFVLSIRKGHHPGENYFEATPTRPDHTAIVRASRAR